VAYLQIYKIRRDSPPDRKKALKPPGFKPPRIQGDHGGRASEKEKEVKFVVSTKPRGRLFWREAYFGGGSLVSGALAAEGFLKD